MLYQIHVFIMVFKDGVDDSLDTLFMELENLNNLNQAVEALNQDPFDDKKVRSLFLVNITIDILFSSRLKTVLM
jgi:hypothetical protein